MEQIEFKLLDHGYVKFIESWGSDERIVESARMSTDGAFRGWGPLACPVCVSAHGRTKPGPHPDCQTCGGQGMAGDEKLLAYLYTHRHLTPFEMCGLTVEIQAPIFVYRQWHRHRTQSYNELSARYTEMPDLAYVPTLERLMMVNEETVNKQAKGSGVRMTESAAENTRFLISESNAAQFALYKALLAQGVAGEVARTVLPVGQYSRMRASANLRNWLHFLTLRMDSHAQWEIRQYANAVGALIAAQWPRTWKLFEGAPRGI